MTFAQRLAANIRRLRKQREWTIAYAADLAGMSRWTWMRLESGEFPQMAGLRIGDLARCFRVDMIELVRAPRGKQRRKKQ